MSSSGWSKQIEWKSIMRSTIVSLLSTLFLLTLFYGVVHPEESADSYVFTRLTKSLPSYSTSSSWIRVDRPDLHWEEDHIPDTIFEDAYETPIWVHPPLPNYLTWPLVQLTENTKILKLLPIILFTLALFFLYKAYKDRLKLWQMLVCFTPIPILTVGLYGVPYFYYDMFMGFFFALTVYLIFKGSKWKYLTACLMVLSKTPAFALIVPLVLLQYHLEYKGDWREALRRSWKMLLPALTLAPYLLATWIISDNPFYIIDHWYTMSYYTRLHYNVFLSENWSQVLIYSGAYIFLPILIYSIWRAWKLRGHYYAPVLGAITMVLASWAFIPYQMLPMLLAMPIMVSLAFSNKTKKET